MRMKITVLIDNTARGNLKAEWGFSLYIEYGAHRILLDTGAGAAFAENADALGVDLAEADFGVLSHCHYDHADGMAEFFRCNRRAPFYLQEACGEDCYGWNETEGLHYIGIRPGILREYADRIVRLPGRFSPASGVTLLPHVTPGLMAVGEKARLYRREACGIFPDGFDHEQSLILETERGLVVLNSCCHAGADTVLGEAAAAFPGQRLYAGVGGFHLYRRTQEEIRAFAGRLRDTGVRHVVTGHCTGQEGAEILRAELGSGVRLTEAGAIFDL